MLRDNACPTMAGVGFTDGLETTGGARRTEYRACRDLHLIAFHADQPNATSGLGSAALTQGAGDERLGASHGDIGAN